MKKKIINILISIIVVIGIIGISYNLNVKKIFVKDGITYALNLDNKPITAFPSRGKYKVSVNCNNGRGKWDYENWKLNIDNIVGDISCNIDFTTITNYQKLNQKIIDLEKEKKDVVLENGYRYEGKTPNNYIWFNNEMWRIIGVFDQTSHGIEGQNLVKIMRDKPIGRLAWDGKNLKNWNESDTKLLLDYDKSKPNSGAYLNAQDGTNSGYCKGFRSLIANCNYTEIGIKLLYRNMIKDVTWYLEDVDDSTYNAETFYNEERGITVNGENPKIGTGKIGLMYPSDYGYSVKASDNCPRNTNLYEYKTNSCAGQSWMYGEGNEWTITANSMFSHNVFTLYTNGGMDHRNANNGYALRPVLYLDSTVFTYDGDGSIVNPYIIGM